MLVQFSFENFLSFGEETTFSMIPAKSRKFKDHIISSTEGKSVSVLPLAALYGANASGKSNFVSAIGFFKALVVGDINTVKDILVPLFKLKENNETKKVRFEIVFKHESVLYTYGTIFSRKRIHEEWLFARFSSYERMLFERVTNEDEKTIIKAGPSLAQTISGKQKSLDLMASIISPRKLFLTECFERGGVSEILKPVLFWFDNCFHVISPSAMATTLPIKAEQDNKFLDFLNNFIVSSDTGISAIKGKKELLNPEKHLSDLPDPLKNRILEDISKLQSIEEKKKGLLSVCTPTNFFNIVIDENKKVYYVQLEIHHKNDKGKDIRFDFFEESDGTQKLMHLAPILQNALKHEQVFVFDEFDCNLHPLLSIAFLKTFLDGIKNKSSKSQFIFTTHDTNLLDSEELFRHDEVFFVEKDKDGCSHITSLADYRVSDGLRVGKGYLFGRFGAVPYLRTLV